MKKEVSYQMNIQSSLIWSDLVFCILKESKQEGVSVVNSQIQRSDVEGTWFNVGSISLPSGKPVYDISGNLAWE